jgi:primary-amine oxidase
MIDGLRNRVVEVDVLPDEGDVHGESNYYGNGFRTVKRVFKTAKESVSDYDASKTRTWVMENPTKRHRSTGGNVGYKLGMSPREQVIVRLTESQFARTCPPS